MHVCLHYHIRLSRNTAYAYTYSPEKMLPKYQQPGEGTLDDTMDDSLTVTISLDDSDGQSRWKNFALGGEDLDPGRARGEPPETSEFGQIKPPPKGREVLAGISGTSGITEIPLTKLPQNVSTLLANKLNPPALGSMRNWEFIAASLGMTMDEIVVLRNAQNPIGQLCRQFSSFKLADLLMLVCDMGRLDVLLSLKNLVKNFNNVKNVGQKQSDVLRERYVETDSVILATSTTEVESLNSISSRDFCDEIVANPAPLILVLHHENKKSKELRKQVSHFLRNLKRYAEKNGHQMVDLDKCLDERDLLGSVQTLFNRAAHVIFALSDDYTRHVVNMEPLLVEDEQKHAQMVKLKQRVHKLADLEVLNNGHRNQRFRLILLEGTETRSIHTGWLSNTLQYLFPRDFSALCVRLFGEGNNGGMLATNETISNEK